MHSRSQHTETRRWLPFFLAALIAALAAILLGTTSSASAAGVAENRVEALNVAGEVLVGPPEHVSAGQSRDAAEESAGIVVATGVAAKTAPFELKALGGSAYQSPGGLIYGPGSKHGHRLTHVLQHGFADATKKTHSVFSSGTGALKTVDEAWILRGAPVAGDPGKYVIPMGRQVGTGGETSVTIIVQPGTSRIITAYPS